MTKQQFIKQFGEDPVDVLGEDWENYLDDFLCEQEQEEFGLTVETTVGDERSPIIMYGEVDNVPVELVSFATPPDDEVIRFYIEHYFNEEEKED